MNKCINILISILLFNFNTLLGQNIEKKEMVNYDFEEFMMKIPHNCKIREDIMEESGSYVCLASPNNDFIFFLYYFEIDDDFDSADRLIEEAAIMDYDARENIMFLTTGPGRDPLCFTSAKNDTNITTIAVRGDFEKNLGLCIFILEQANTSKVRGFDSIVSFRLK